MKCAIQLVFDEKSQIKVNEIRKLLLENGISDNAVPINHISLADIEIDNEQLSLINSILKKFSEENSPIKLILASAGSFMTSENVLFLCPIITEDLLDYNNKVVAILTENKIKCGKYYTKNNWQPHCTIAIRISDEELLKGFKALKSCKLLPLEISADKVDLLQYDPKPYTELLSHNL